MKMISDVYSNVIADLGDVTMQVYDYDNSKKLFMGIKDSLINIHDDLFKIIQICDKMEIKLSEDRYNFGLTFEGSFSDYKILCYLNKEISELINYLDMTKDIVLNYEVDTLARIIINRIDTILKVIMLGLGN